MNKDFNKVMSDKSNNDLIEIGTSYKKYTSEALIALLNELETRNLQIPNIIDIENWIKELEVKNMNVGKIIGEIELHPNIERVAKLILLGIPISIVQLAISAFYFYQTIGSNFFSQVFNLLSFSLIFIWVVFIILASWIKSGTSISRIVIGLLIGFSVLTNISDIINSEKEELPLKLVSIINLLIASYILYLLFNKDTSNWYDSKANREENTTTSNN